MIGFIVREDKAKKIIRKTFIALILLGFLLVTIVPIVRADFYAHCYWVHTGTKKTIAWAAEPEATGYELQIRRMAVNGKTVYQSRVPGVQREITWKTPGLYVIYVRWYKLIDGVTTFGEWKNSLQLESSLVLIESTLTPRPWIIIVPTLY